MGQVTVSVNGRNYRLRCGDGEEHRLVELASHVGERVEQLAMQFGQFGDERLLLMAALLATDEMLDLRSRLAALEASYAAGAPYVVAAAEAVEPDAGQSVDSTSTRAMEAAPLPVASPSQPAEEAAAAAPAAEVTAPRPQRPVSPRRGSLEARLAQARHGPLKAGG